MGSEASMRKSGGEEKEVKRANDSVNCEFVVSNIPVFKRPSILTWNVLFFLSLKSRARNQTEPMRMCFCFWNSDLMCQCYKTVTKSSSLMLRQTMLKCFSLAIFYLTFFISACIAPQGNVRPYSQKILRTNIQILNVFEISGEMDEIEIVHCQIDGLFLCHSVHNRNIL